MTTSVSDRIITDWALLDPLLADWKRRKEVIVFTNGVFDLIHPGHVLYLEEAASLGTRLIVGLNSDVSTKTLGKGPHRPINHQKARAMVVGALRSVDLVVVFDGSTPLELIKRIEPNVLVKGGDYTIDQIIGSKEVMASGGIVKQLRFAEGYSTTSIEQKILKSIKSPD